MSLENLKHIFEDHGTITGTPTTPMNTNLLNFSTATGVPTTFTNTNLLNFNSTLDEFIPLGNTIDKSTFLPIYNSFSNSSILLNITNTDSEPAFPQNYTPLNQIVNNEFTNNDILGQHGWPDLYNANHKSKDISIPSPRSANPFQPRAGGLDIRDGVSKASLTSPSRNSLVGNSKEPYIISEIPTDSGFSGGRILNAGNRNLPFARATTDTLRVGAYLASPAGLANIALKNADLFINQTVVRKDDKLIKVPQRFNNGYNPLNTLLQVSPIARLIGQSPIILTQSGYGEGYGSKDVGRGFLPTSEDKLNNTFTRGGGDPTANSSIDNEVEKTSTGDKMTLAKMIVGDYLSSSENSTKGLDSDNQLNFNVEDKKEGMPFYFKDLRDNKYIFFRAYVDSINENLSPEWSPQNYIGRSEPVFVYGRAERVISLNLTLFAQTRSELDKIYLKMNKLTSLCYPEYAEDTFLSTTLNTVKTRMKPPLMKLRFGDLFGKTLSNNGQDGGLTGFLESLSYSIPDSATYETENNAKVPKYIQVAISYKVLHDEPPNMNTQFYGFEGK